MAGKLRERRSGATVLGMKTRTIMVGGELRRVNSRLATRFEVVRGVLLGELTLAAGARRLRMPRIELADLVEGARRYALAAMGVPTEVTDFNSRYEVPTVDARSS
jgi:hypothetical protein